MFIISIYRAIFSVITGLSIIMGLTGFNIKSHECQHTGIKVYEIAGSYDIKKPAVNMRR